MFSSSWELQISFRINLSITPIDKQQNPKPQVSLGVQISIGKPSTSMASTLDTLQLL
jgi:hypothetical protein